MNEVAKNINLWEKVGTGCLDKAQENIPTAATIEMVSMLVETAISIDLLNLRWSGESQYDAPVFWKHPFSP